MDAGHTCSGEGKTDSDKQEKEGAPSESETHHPGLKGGKSETVSEARRS